MSTESFGKYSATNKLAVALLLSIVLVSIYSFPWSISNQRANGDEAIVTSNNPPQEIDGKMVELYLQVDPPVLVLTNQSRPLETLLKFRLFDENNSTLNHVTYFVRINEPYKSATPILADLFHSHYGILILRMEPADKSDNTTRIEAEQESVFDAWLADENNSVRIKTPFFQHASVYRIEVEIFSTDDDSHILSPEEVPRFETWIGRGESLTKAIMYNNQTYSITVISYLDALRNFNYDPQKMAFGWSVPFDWNASKIKNIQNNGIFVHQAIIIPRALIDPQKAVAVTANGIPLSGASFAIDEFEYHDRTVFHYLINKNHLLNMSESIPQPTTTEITFSFSQNENVIPEFGTSALILAVIMAAMAASVILTRYRKIVSF